MIDFLSKLDNLIILLGIFIFLTLISFLHFKLSKTDIISELKSSEEIKKEKKKLSKNDLESKILLILETKDESDINSLKLNKLTGKSLPVKTKIKKNLLDLVNNPYNTVSVPKIIMWSIVCAAIGFSLGTFLKNPAAIVCLSMIGVSIPFNLIGLVTLRRQLSIMSGNLGLITTHLGVYMEAPNFADSLRSMLTILTPSTREYKAVYNAYKGLTEANITLEVILSNMKRELLADMIVGQYLDGCLTVETNNSEYKEALEYLPERLEPLVTKNVTFVNVCFYCYMVYIVACIIVVFILIYYRMTDFITYQFLAETPKGQLGCFVLMSMLIVAGFMISKVATIIKLDKTGGK